MLNKFSIAKRLALGFGIVLALLIAVAFSGYWGMESVTNETISMLHGDQAISQKSDEVKIDTLQLRVSGVQGLADTFARNPTSKTPGEAAILSEQADRLLASDVIWDDLYKGPLTAQLQSEGISGVTVPDSKFVSNRDLTSERSMSLLLTRLRGTSSGGTPTGLHGTNIVDVKTLPGGQTLSESTTNTVVATTGLAFVVAIHDGGDSQEVGIKVTVTIQKPQGAIVKTKTLQLINPGQTKTVTIGDLGQVPFAQKTTVNVDVASVQGEHDTTNNKASYDVTFSG